MTAPHIVRKIELIAASALKINPRNARRHSAKQIGHLEAIIARVGFVQPVLIDQDNVLIAGHGRLAAARQLGMSEVPAIRLSHLSQSELRALAIFDNRIAELASWDETILREEFGDLLAEDLAFSLSEGTAFEAAEIDAVMHVDDFGQQEPDPADAVAPSPPARVARSGDVFIAGPHRVGCGNALDPGAYRPVLKGERARACITDPPYNVPVNGHVSGKGKHREFTNASGEKSGPEFIAFLATALGRILDHLKDGGLIYAFMDGQHLFELFSAARQLGLEQKALVTWAKLNGGMGGLYRNQTEFVGVFKHDRAPSLNNVKLGRYGRNRTTLWSYPGQNAFGRGRDAALAIHPTTKPVSMLADAILDCTERGDVVLDPFAGSASTIIAAHRTGRIGAGIEIDPLYVDAALARLKAVTGLEPVRERDGARWSDLVAAAAKD